MYLAGCFYKGSGPSDGQRVMRGGSWNNKPENLRASNRNRNNADNRNNSIDFRLAHSARTAICRSRSRSVHEQIGEPLHVERGLSREADAVSMFGCSGVNSAVDMASQTAKGLLKTFALTMIGGMTSGVTSTEVMLVICPEHAGIMFKEGYSKADIRSALFEMARVSFEKISDDNVELLSKRRPSWFKNGRREIGVVDRPEDIWLVVAGGAGAKSAYIPGRTSTHLQTIKIE